MSILQNFSAPFRGDIKLAKKRVEMKDAKAMFNLGCFHANGMYGLPQNRTKALELWHGQRSLVTLQHIITLGMLISMVEA